MGVTPVGSGTGAVSTATGSAAGSGLGAQGLGSDAFLKLLVAQLQYQNPLQPMDDTQFVTQLATFRTLEVLQAIKADLDTLVQRTGAAAGAGQGTGSQGTAAGSGAASSPGGTQGSGSAGSGAP